MLEQLGRLIVAYLLTLPAAWNRERYTRIMGLRTFPLVAVGACAYGLIGLSFVSGDHPDAKARLMQGLLSGMGFLGGGAILKMEDQVKGTASAATIWIVGALGFAVAFDQWWVALTLSVLNWITLYFLTPVKDDEQRE